MALCACSSPESECREGVDKMRERVNAAIGSGEHKEMGDPVVQAHNELDMAYTEMLTKNYKGCMQYLEQARTTLDQSKK
jgi:hypothetical protein